MLSRSTRLSNGYRSRVHQRSWSSRCAEPTGARTEIRQFENARDGLRAVMNQGESVFTDDQRARLDTQVTHAAAEHRFLVDGEGRRSRHYQALARKNCVGAVTRAQWLIDSAEQVLRISVGRRCAAGRDSRTLAVRRREHSATRQSAQSAARRHAGLRARQSRRRHAVGSGANILCVVVGRESARARVRWHCACSQLPDKPRP